MRHATSEELTLRANRNLSSSKARFILIGQLIGMSFSRTSSQWNSGGDTIEIVEKLRELWPDKQLHLWFEQIIGEGTGPEFSFEDNRDWLRRGRPILEAFFHARTMLEFAVKYGRELEHAPRMMPSGWAALLELYSARYDVARGESGAAAPVASQIIDPKKASDERSRL